MVGLHPNPTFQANAVKIPTTKVGVVVQKSSRQVEKQLGRPEIKQVGQKVIAQVRNQAELSKQAKKQVRKQESKCVG